MVYEAKSDGSGTCHECGSHAKSGDMFTLGAYSICPYCEHNSPVRCHDCNRLVRHKDVLKKQHRVYCVDCFDLLSSECGTACKL